MDKMIVIKMKLLKMIVIMIVVMKMIVRRSEGARLLRGRKMKVNAESYPVSDFEEFRTTESYEPVPDEDLQEEDFYDLEDFEVPPPPEYAEEEEEEGTPSFVSGPGGRRGGARKSKIRPWPKAEIPYVIWGSTKTKRKVLSSLAKIEANTCLRFLPRSSEVRYVVIREDDGGCWTSSLGYPSSDKKVVVGLGSGCRGPGRIIHEVLHASGFLHEHVRPDRGNYIAINWDNIKDRTRSNFKIDYRYPTLSIPYDYKSIMHYGRHAFAQNKSEPTIEPKIPVTGKLGGSTLTQFDIQRINAFYQC